MKFTMLGVAHVHAPSYAEILSSRGSPPLIWDADADAASAFAGRHGLERAADLSEAVDRADAVVICAETSRHRVLVEAAAAHGKHILCEKPLATSMVDAAAIADAAASSSAVFAMAMPCRFHPAFVRASGVFDRGALGEILAIAATNQGTFPGMWFDDPELAGGGAVMDHTVHVADMMRHLLHSEVVSVFAVTGNRFIEGCRSEDAACISLEFENGTIATIDPSWSRPDPYATWGNVFLEVAGTRGTLSFDLFAENLDVWRGGHRIHGWGSPIDHLMIDSFMASCTQGAPVVVSLQDGLASTEVALLALMSARENRQVGRGELQPR